MDRQARRSLYVETLENVLAIAPGRIAKILPTLSDDVIGALFDAMALDAMAERHPLHDHPRIDP